MSNGLKVGLGVVVLGSFLSLASIGGCISTQNEFIRHEAGITAQHEANKVSLSTHFLKVKEMAQVPDMYVADLKSLYTSTMQGRYGAEGSKALMQFITEHNPNLDASVYKTLQIEIASGRETFRQDQKSLLDKKRAYEVSFRSFPGSAYAGLLGYPKVDLTKYNVVTDDVTERAFETGKQEPIRLR